MTTTDATTEQAQVQSHRREMVYGGLYVGYSGYNHDGERHSHHEPVLSFESLLFLLSEEGKQRAVYEQEFDGRHEIDIELYFKLRKDDGEFYSFCVQFCDEGKSPCTTIHTTQVITEGEFNKKAEQLIQGMFADMLRSAQRLGINLNQKEATA